MYRFAVNEVVCCPQNKTAWDEASVKLNCTQDDSRVNRYHCLPNRQKSALLEFCYDQFSGRYEKEHCIHLAESGFLNTDSSSCISFKNGCPTKTYLGDEIYQYPACLQINPHDKCYIADPSCPNISRETTTTYITTTDSQETVTSFNTNTTEIYNQPDVNVAVPIYVGLIAFIPIIVLILLILRSARLYMRDKKDIADEETSPMLEKHPSENIERHTTVVQESAFTENKDLQNKEKESHDFFGKKELWKGNLKLEDKKPETRLDYYRRLFPSEKDKHYTCEKKDIIGFLNWNENLINLVDSDMSKFDNEDEKETLYAFLNENENVSHNLEFWFDKSRENPLIGKYCRSAGYQRNKNEVCILVPVILSSRLIEKLGNNILIHPTIVDEGIHDEIETKLNIPKEIIKHQEYGFRARYIKCIGTDNFEEVNNIIQGMIVGKEGVGKTTLLWRLQRRSEEEIKNVKSTVGITENYFRIQEDGSLEKMENAKVSFEKGIIRIWDFAGQGEYYATHHLFLSPRAFYVLVVKMEDSPKIEMDNKMKESVGNDEEYLCDADGTLFKEWSWKDFLKFWLRLISFYGSYKGNEREKKSRIFVVITHTEGKPRSDIKKFREDLRKIIQQENFPKVRTEFVLKNNTEASKTISEIEKEIVSLTEESGKMKIPSRWIHFESMFQKLDPNGNLANIDSLLKLIDDSKHLRENYDAELNDMLEQYHLMGQIMYFSEKPLNDIIILKRQWLIDAFKAIIRNSPIDDENINSQENEDWNNFSETGKICDSALTKLLKKNEIDNHKETFLKYMKKLSMICEITDESEEEKQYYIPCVNKSRCDLVSNQQLRKQLSPILFFEFKWLPHNLFPCIVAKCLSTQGWEYKDIGKSSAKLQYHKCQVFVSMLSESRRIMIQVKGKENGCAIQKHFEQSVETLCRIIPRKVKYNQGYMCRDEEGNPVDCITWQKDISDSNMDGENDHENHFEEVREINKFWMEKPQNEHREAGECVCFGKRHMKDSSQVSLERELGIPAPLQENRSNFIKCWTLTMDLACKAVLTKKQQIEHDKLSSDLPVETILFQSCSPPLETCMGVLPQEDEKQMTDEIERIALYRDYLRSCKDNLLKEETMKLLEVKMTEIWQNISKIVKRSKNSYLRKEMFFLSAKKMCDSDFEKVNKQIKEIDCHKSFVSKEKNNYLCSFIMCDYFASEAARVLCQGQLRDLKKGADFNSVYMKILSHPKDIDESISEKMEKLRLIRYNFAKSSKTKVKDEKYKTLWNDLKEVVTTQVTDKWSQHLMIGLDLLYTRKFQNFEKEEIKKRLKKVFPLMKKRIEDLTRHSTGDLPSPVKFHEVHGDNVILQNENSIAKRGDSFCKAICFSNRPIAVNEKVFIRFAETSSNWSGVLRFGFTNIDPATVQGSDLPRYACPDMTNKQGCWAKALGEHYAAFNNILHFYVTRNGDVMYGVNGEELGMFFSGVSTLKPLWTLLDIYGNTIGIEFVNQERLSTGPLGLNNVLQTPPPIPQRNSQTAADLRTPFSSLSLGNLHTDSAMPSSPVAPAVAPLIPVRYYQNINFRPMCWHELTGKNIRIIDVNRTIAVRSDEEYCNAYVFSSRPLKCGEKIVIQVLGVERSFIGGLAFGFTACDPREVNPDDLPDDSDLLLDRKEYWVVNKDVCRSPEIGDELCFHLTLNGEVRYSKNNTKVATLMHVDKTLPLWLFFDVYGNIQKIRSVGVTTHVPPVPPRPRSTPFMGVGHHGPQLTVTLPARDGAGRITGPPTSPETTPTSSAHKNMLRSYSVPSTTTDPNSSISPKTKPHVTSTSQESTIDPVAENEANECTVCYERSVNAVLYTCGHMCMCYECAIVVKNHKSALCPICRQEIKDVIKIYKT